MVRCHAACLNRLRPLPFPLVYNGLEVKRRTHDSAPRGGRNRKDRSKTAEDVRESYTFPGRPAEHQYNSQLRKAALHGGIPGRLDETDTLFNPIDLLKRWSFRVKQINTAFKAFY